MATVELEAERLEYRRCLALDPTFAESAQWARHASRPEGELCPTCVALGFACFACLGAADVDPPLAPGDCGGCDRCSVCVPH